MDRRRSDGPSAACRAKMAVGVDSGGSPFVHRVSAGRRPATRTRRRPDMPRYLLSVIQPDGEPPAPEILDPIMRDVAQYDAGLRASGAWVFNAALHDAASSTVVQLLENGELTMTDGPYVEAKEHVGGLSIID